MNYHLFRYVSGALVIICAAAPVSATVARKTTAFSSTLGPVKQAAQLVHGTPRKVRMAGSQALATVTAPVGCTGDGVFIFIGAPNNNFAGGQSGGFGGDAGVLAGGFNEACDSYSVIGAGSNNTIGGDGLSLAGAIVGGAQNAMEASPQGFIGGGDSNRMGAAAPYSTGTASVIVGGQANTVGSPQSFIGAGYQNSIVATALESFGQSAFIGAGYNNAVAGNFAAIVAGRSNSVAADNASIVGGTSNNASTSYSFIGDGLQNNIFQAPPGSPAGAGAFSVISGGYGNTVASGSFTGAEYATIGGGSGNEVNGEYATVAGGGSNLGIGYGAAVAGGNNNSAAGAYTAIPGGLGNRATGTDSFAAGTSSNAANAGTFVWSDDWTAATALSSTASNQFLARAAGGFYLYSSANLKAGVRLAPGSGSWSSLSDRAAKTALEGVDDAQILAKVASLPVSEWSYSAQGTGVRHIGPMAQDFRAAFGLGEDDRHITTIDEEGVALAAIKALQAEVAEKERQLGELRRTDDSHFRKLKDLDTKYASLEQRLKALEDTMQTKAQRSS
jgi:hypothetical protein